MMSSTQRRVWIWSLLAALLGVGLFSLRTPEPARTALDIVATVCSASSPREREHQLGVHVADPLLLQFEEIEEAGELRYSRAEQLEQLELLDGRRPNCGLQLESWTLAASEENSRWLSGELVFSDSRAIDLHAERRTVRAQFRPFGDRWRLERLRLGAPQRTLPEARP
jgi:hypothetical protein